MERVKVADIVKALDLLRAFCMSIAPTVEALTLDTDKPKATDRPAARRERVKPAAGTKAPEAVQSAPTGTEAALMAEV